MLADGGSAADAAVAACLASCVAETVMTGLLGGGHAIHYDAATGRARNLDCFVAVPGLGAEPGAEPSCSSSRCRSATELVHYAVGVGLVRRARRCRRASARSAAEHGRLPWARLVEPALRLARDGVELPPAHAACLAMLAPVMTMNEGARDLRARRPAPPGRRDASSSRASCGRSSCSPTRGRERVRRLARPTALLDADGRARRARHARRPRPRTRPRWSEPAEVPYAGLRVLTRGGLAPLAPLPGGATAAARAGAAERVRSRSRARSTGPMRTATRPTSSPSTRRATPASSRPASGSARATSSRGSTCT